MKPEPCLLIFIFILLCGTACAQKQALDNRMHHLRKGTDREWSSFPLHAKDSQLIINFNSKDADTSKTGTIYLRQYDVNQSWKVFLNNEYLGSLVVDEKEMIDYFEIPLAILKKRDNILRIESDASLFPFRQLLY